MTVLLPVDKLSRLNNLVYALSAKVSGSKRQLQSLARSLNFACQVVHGGRTFVRRVINCVNKLKHLSHRCRLTSDICSKAVQRPSNDARFLPVLLHSNECILPWFWTCLSKRLVCRLLGGFPLQTPPTHAYFHLTSVLLVTLSTRHFV